ncbi:MAG: hypothetical protein GOU98_00580 [Candidatus Altiarchaeota archaeon]|nr:hypothetical protein [Candidatus Altiarchaeota archaeon]
MGDNKWGNQRVMKSYQKSRINVLEYLGGSGITHLNTMTDDFMSSVTEPYNIEVVEIFHKYASNKDILIDAIMAAKNANIFPTNILRYISIRIEDALDNTNDYSNVSDLVDKAASRAVRDFLTNCYGRK